MLKEDSVNTGELHQGETDQQQLTSETPSCLEARFAKHPLGRVLLHLACLAHDGKWRWHWAGARREFYTLAHVHHEPVKA